MKIETLYTTSDGDYSSTSIQDVIAHLNVDLSGAKSRLCHRLVGYDHQGAIEAVNKWWPIQDIADTIRSIEEIQKDIDQALLIQKEAE